MVHRGVVYVEAIDGGGDDAAISKVRCVGTLAEVQASKYWGGLWS